MSTLMSVDMNIERSSTRLHAPPGGKSSFTIGYDEPVKTTAPKAAPKPAAENIPKQTPAVNNDNVVRRVRQAPGGTSTFTLG